MKILTMYWWIHLFYFWKFNIVYYLKIWSQEWLETNESSSLLATLYKALDEVVKVPECEIYGYNPDSDEDPCEERGTIWSYHFLFYNKKLKRIVSFRFSCVSNLDLEDGISY
nr:repressor of RNA polymerase III transcription MAF1 homolog isoform X1 [Ipomoea batatas]